MVAFVEPNKWSIQWWCRNAALPKHMLVPLGLALSVLLLPVVVAYELAPPEPERQSPREQVPLEAEALIGAVEGAAEEALPGPFAPSAPAVPRPPVELSAEAGPVEAPADAENGGGTTTQRAKTVRWWRDVHEPGASRSWIRSYPMPDAVAARSDEAAPDRGEVLTAAGLTLIIAGIGLRLAPLVAGSRLERHEVREHPVRRRMLDHLEAHPGATTAELAEVAGIGCGRAIYHLSILEREQIVRGRRVETRRRYFPVGAPRVDDAALTVRDIARPERQTGRIVQVLRRSPGTSLSEIARLLGMSPGQAHYHVTKLDEIGVVYRVRRGRRVRHYLTEVGQSLSARAQNSFPVDQTGGAVTA